MHCNKPMPFGGVGFWCGYARMLGVLFSGQRWAVFPFASAGEGSLYGNCAVGRIPMKENGESD
ncbi:MAG: hypothetical protein PUC41_05845 [Oscillospiraceae bacterium]|nr:hypothetical protein [Oscillospiraceae bacterium]